MGDPRRQIEGEGEGDGLRMTGVVCSCNEAHHLPACLGGLAFCDELIVIDLDSTDDTAEVAERCGARVVHHRRVPVVEEVRRFAVEQASHDWVAFLDPDMVIPSHRGMALRRFVADHPQAARVWADGRNHFRGKPIHHGRWGGLHGFLVALHRRRVDLRPEVHEGIRPLPGFSDERMTAEREADLVQHFWVASTRQMIEKHRRYARQEGPIRYAKGERFGWAGALRRVAHEFKRALIWRAGWRDGASGVFLAGVWAWYAWACLWSVRRVQRDRPIGEAGPSEPLDRRHAA